MVDTSSELGPIRDSDGEIGEQNEAEEDKNKFFGGDVAGDHV